MEFFDRKEEVMDIQLTQYGKYLLSQGKFRPEFYAFYDDDILYDQRYAFTSSAGVENVDYTIEEVQNEIELRIKETPRMKAQYVFSGIESQITKNWAQGDECGELGTVLYQGAAQGQGLALCTKQPKADKNYSMALPLGRSGFESSFAPSWNIEFLNGGLHSYTGSLTGSNFGLTMIPQLSCSCRFETYVTFVDDDGSIIEHYVDDDYGFYSEMESRKDFVSYVDRSLIQIQPNYIFLDVEEKNTDFLKENFDIEVYKVDSDGSEQQLFFFDEDSDVGGTEYKPHHVEYYFDIFADEEILPIYYCKSVNVAKKKNILSDQQVPFKCPDPTPTPANVYGVPGDYDEEPC